MSVLCLHYFSEIEGDLYVEAAGACPNNYIIYSLGPFLQTHLVWSPGTALYVSVATLSKKPVKPSNISETLEHIWCTPGTTFAVSGLSLKKLLQAHQSSVS